MGWLYARRSVDSPKNGRLDVVTKFGKTAVMTDGFFQSGNYIQEMFLTMLRLLPSEFLPKKVMLLGLGAGSCIPVIRRRFPKAHVVAVEYDPAMIEIARKTYVQADGRVEIVEGDVREVLPRLQTTFDLILVDLFHRRRVATIVGEGAFLEQLDRLLAWQGCLLVNLFEEFQTFTSAIESVFSLHQPGRFRFNHIGLYRHHGMGKMGEGVSEGFEDREQSRTYLQAVMPQGKRHTMIEEDGSLGLRTRLGPLVFDAFTCEREPDCHPGDSIRIVSWQPYHGSSFPGWWKIPSLFTIHFKRGCAILEDGTYWTHWTNHAKRHRAKFLEGGAYEVVEVNLETFAAAYHATRFLDPLTRRSFVSVLRHHLARHPQDVHLTIAREVDGGRIVSGLATIDYADISQSDHVIAFVHPDAQQTSVGVGLIDHWHARCLHAGIRFLNFGLLRRPGDPRSWQGYTNFKRQFHLYEILYPQPVFRLVWPKRRVI